MATRYCKEIESLTNSQVDEFLNSFDTILCDVDGVLRTGSRVVEGSPEAIRSFRKIGKDIYYVSNNAMHSRKDYLKKLKSLGFSGELQDIFTTSYICAQFLKQQQFSKTVYVLGPKGIAQELDEVGIRHDGYGCETTPENWYNPDTAKDIVKTFNTDIGCVISGLTYDISYIKLIKAVSYLNNPDVIFLGTSNVPMFQITKGFVVPADGPFIDAVQTATGRSPTILGKPKKDMFEAVKAIHPGINPERTLMIGDYPPSDILFGKTCGLITLMVGTGSGTLGEVKKWENEPGDEIQQQIPEFYVNKLGDLVPHIERNIFTDIQFIEKYIFVRSQSQDWCRDCIASTCVEQGIFLCNTCFQKKRNSFINYSEI